MWMMSKSTHGTRRAPRYYLGSVVELTSVDSGQMKVALVRALSLYGCLVKTEMPVKEAAKVALKIVHSGTHFSALGLVVGCVGDKTSRGIGISLLRLTQQIRHVLKLGSPS